MIDSHLHDMLKKEIPSGESLYWLEEISLRPYVWQRWFWNGVIFIGCNLAIIILYLTQFGGFSLKTTTVLLLGMNFGAISLFLLEVRSDLKLLKIRTVNIITDLRVMTLAFNGNGNKSSAHIEFDDVDNYRVLPDKKTNRVQFLEQRANKKPSILFQIQTAQSVSDFEAVISPIFKGKTS